MQSRFWILLKEWRSASILALAIGFAFLAGCGSDNDNTIGSAQEIETNTVETRYGSLRGYAESGAWIYKGVPFAKPPIGDLRWRASIDPDAWTGVRDAMESADVCTQIDRTPQWVPTGPVTSPDTFIGSEDCLYLDIYRPQTDENDLPVFVWIHGGGWVLGGATSYDGTALAVQENVIVVVIQYRIGPMGNFSNSAMADGENGLDASGNFRNLDQIQALEWVQENIADFGGDPSTVTIGGQSAGGVEVYYLLLSPLTTGLFSNAISVSASFGDWANAPPSDTLSNYIIDWLLLDDGTVPSDGTATYPYYSDADWTNAAVYRAAMSSTAIKQYLRVKSDYRIQLATAEANYHMSGAEGVPVSFPILDGTVLPSVDGYDAIASGNYRHVPLLHGKTEHDVPENTRIDAISQAFMAESSSNTIYNMFFTWKGGGDPDVEEFANTYGAPHAADVPFWFGNMDPITPTAYSELSFTEANRPGSGAALLRDDGVPWFFYQNGRSESGWIGFSRMARMVAGCTPDYMILDATMTDLSLEIGGGGHTIVRAAFCFR